MPKCKDCFHYGACINILTKTFPKTTQEEINRVANRESNCKHFNNKSNVVAVVRCKDCKFNRLVQPDGTVHCGKGSFCGVGTVFRKANDFCSYGLKECEGK